MLNKTEETFPEIQEFFPNILANNPITPSINGKISESHDADHSLTSNKPSPIDHYCFLMTQTRFFRHNRSHSEQMFYLTKG
jgi:hypothetical protein